MDVLVAQELGTSSAKFAQIAAALHARGFVHSTGSPGPTARSPKCRDPPRPYPGSGWTSFGSFMSGIENGGLMYAQDAVDNIWLCFFPARFCQRRYCRAAACDRQFAARYSALTGALPAVRAVLNLGLQDLVSALTK